jgi:hypothetical protein
MRYTRLAAVMVLLVSGCTTARPDEPVVPVPSPASVSPTGPAVPLRAFEAAGIRATRVVPDLETDRYFLLTDTGDDIVVAGSTLIANSVDRNLRANRVMTSTDRGRTWQGTDLPGATASEGWVILSRTGPVVAAVSSSPRDPTWLTGDGVTWRGGPMPLEPGAFQLARPLQQVDGAVVAANSKDGRRIVRTRDGGATWQTVDCPAMFRPTDDPNRCEVVTPAGGALWVRWWELSIDAGKTWRPVTIVPDPGVTIRPMLRDTVTLPTGGWLSPVWTGFPPDTSAYLLVRSLDGITWETVIPYPCDKAAEQGAKVSRPQALGNRWLVAYTCRSKDDTAQRSFLYLLDRDGTGAKVLATIDQPARWFGAPVTAGDTVVVPEIRYDERTGPSVTLLHLNA